MCRRTASRLAFRAARRVGLVLLLLPRLAAAQLTDLGNVTRDGATGLRWLDVTETRNLSYDAVVSGAGGWTAQGWRHATLAEVCQLFASYAIAPASPCGSGDASQPGDGVRALQALLGITRVLGGQQEDTFGFADNGTPGPSVGRGRLTYNLLADSSTAGVEATSLFGREDALATHGHFLVRENQPPVADAGPDQSAWLGDVVTLGGSADDPDGDPITAWLWAVEASPTGSFPYISDPFTPAPPFEGDLEGDYVLSLVASDGTDWSLSDTVTITYSINQPPTAVAIADPTSGVLPLTVQFDGTSSFDPEGAELTHIWDFGDGTAPFFGSTPVHTYEIEGVFSVLLRVDDERGQYDVDTIEITVRLVPIPALPTTGLALLGVLLAGTTALMLRSRRRGGPH